jgi:hypothetical protein
LATTLQFVDQPTFAVPGEGVVLRTMAKMVLATWLAILLTGSIRKWVFPGVSVLYLLQDIPIAAAYLYAIWKGFYLRGYLLLGILVMTVVLTFQGLMQVIVTGLSPFVAAVGLHNYLYYLPMMLVFPLCFTLHNRQRFLRWNIYASIPMSALVIAQAMSPTTAWVNHTSEGDAFGVPGADIARVAGTFNFGLFYGMWVASVVAYTMGEWLLPKHRRAVQRTSLLAVCTMCINLCHLVSGSRNAISQAVIAIFGAAVAAVILGSTRALTAIAGILFLLPVAAGVTYIISPDEFNIVAERFTGENYVSDGRQRLSDAIVGFITVPEFDLIGAGIGMGVDAAHVGSADTYNFTYQLSEQDMIRNVMELGSPVGLFYAVTRLMFLTGMIFFAARLVRQGSSPHVLPLAFYLLGQGYIGDLTRAATMTASQVFLAYAFILGTYYHPDNTGQEVLASDSMMRSA